MLRERSTRHDNAPTSRPKLDPAPPPPLREQHSWVSGFDRRRDFCRDSARCAGLCVGTVPRNSLVGTLYWARCYRTPLLTEPSSIIALPGTVADDEPRCLREHDGERGTFTRELARATLAAISR